MGNYESQRRAGSTIIKAKSAKEAMANARNVFGPDVEVLSIEKVNDLYCLEVSNPPSDSQESLKIRHDLNNKKGVNMPKEPLRLEANLLKEKSKNSVSSIEYVHDEMDGVARLEKKFEELSRQLVAGHVQLTPHQGAGLNGLSSIRERLIELGFAEPFVGKLAGAMIENGAMEYDKDMCLRILTSWLNQLGAGHNIEMGWNAIVGPAGSGKTTTIAKLASRAAAQWGPDAVGLVTTDFYRIGAYEQLRMFGEMLGIKVWPARSLPELDSIKQNLTGKKVVFVDTIGTGRDDEKMRDQMEMLSQLGINSTMAIQANLDRNVMRVDLARWREAGAKGVVITKLDQALSLTELVESLIIKSMPVTYAANGQRVPADLHKVSSLLLAHKALRSHSTTTSEL